MNAGPLVSVIIPTHNRREMLAEALATVFAQTYRNFEVIVVDDGSTDGTREFLAAEYPGQVQVVAREKLANAGAARNAGAALAKGEFFAFLDSDDFWYPRKLEVMLAEMQAGGERVTLVGGACDHVDASGERVIETLRPPRSATHADFCIKMFLPGSMSNNLVRASAFRRIGGFDESLTRAEDKDLFIRLLDGHEVRYTPEVTAKVRIHGEARAGMSLDLAYRCRRQVDMKIADLTLRRRASAWTHFFFFERYWASNKPKAMALLVTSFLTFPFRVHPSLRRLYPAVRRLSGIAR